MVQIRQPMSDSTYAFFWRVGWGLIAIAAFPILAAVSTGSHLLRNLPNSTYDYVVFAIVIYLLLTGLGVLKLRKWGVVLLFVPGVLFLAFVLYFSWIGGTSSPDSNVILPIIMNGGFLVFLFLIPGFMVKHWKELK